METLVNCDGYCITHDGWNYFVSNQGEILFQTPCLTCAMNKYQEIWERDIKKD